MGKAKTDEITPLQRKTLEAICRFVDAKGFPPTVKELSEIFEISPASAHYTDSGMMDFSLIHFAVNY